MMSSRRERETVGQMAMAESYDSGRVARETRMSPQADMTLELAMCHLQVSRRGEPTMKRNSK